MDLAFRDLGGSGQSILFIHGLFGSSQNWTQIGRRLAALGRCVALDMRNHGRSPHSPGHSLADCVSDLRDWVRVNARGPVRLVGHSMGGLAAMGFAIAYPEQTAAIAVLDIAPRAYPLDHEREFAVLHADLSGCGSREELDALVQPMLPDPLLRQFLLTNAVRAVDGRGFRWRLNVAALESSSISRDFQEITGSYAGPALFVAGGRSGYLTPADHPAVHRHFPRARIEVIPEADHWPNVSAPERLTAILASFFA